jgi:ABC-type uncharacterized transport system permease subunit
VIELNPSENIDYFIKDESPNSIRIWIEYFKISFKQIFEFPLDTLGKLAQSIIRVIIWLSFWNVMMSVSDAFNHWSQSEILVWIGFMEISWSLLSFVIGWDVMMYYISDKGIEIELTRPVNPLLQFIGSNIPLKNSFGFLVGITLITLGWVNGAELHFFGIIIGFLVQICGTIALGALFGIGSCTGFWLGRATWPSKIFGQTLTWVNRMPIFILPLSMIMIFTIGIPIGLLASIPAAISLYQEYYTSWTIIFLTLFGSIIIAMTHVKILLILWNKGLQRYESVGGR